ncbi:MAG: CapA family protein [Leptolyngbyaceae cyanobacterium]
MVHATVNLSPDRLSTKALAAAGQFRAIALWLNEPLIPEGIYAQVCQDSRPGCVRVVLEFERLPLQKPLTQFICHLMWQLNSPLIEGINLIARPIGEPKAQWQQRVRIMTPALKEQLQRNQGQGSPAAAMPPTLVQRSSVPQLPGLNLHLLTDQLKTMRAFMLTGSAVAAFVFGCMIEVVMSNRPGPALPFRERLEAEASDRSAPTVREAKEPQLPEFQSTDKALLVDRQRSADSSQSTTSAALETTPVSYKTELDSNRPNIVNAALEPVGVLQHERLELPQDPTITLLFGGDVDLDSLPYSQLEHDGQLLSGLPAYRQADIAMVNLQDPLAQSATSLEEELLERQRPDAINLLKTGGVDLVNLAGKQALASGEQGLVETLDTLDRHGIFRVGAGRGEREARRPEIVDVKGQRIAYLSYDRDFSLAADPTLSGVNAVVMQDIVKDIQAIRDEVDWLVVSYRWSTEPPDTPAESQTNLAKLAIDQGADLVVGQHPDQLQGAELYKGRPIAYSLGDFMHGQSTSAPTAETAVLQVALREGQMKVDLIPVTVSNGQPQQASGAEAERILQKVRDASQDFLQPLPSSVVLDVRSPGAVEVPTSNDPSNDGFTGEDAEETPWQAPVPEEAEPATPDESLPLNEAAPSNASESEPASETAPPVAEPDAMDIEIEDFPDDLLNEWGPKDSPNTIYEPESRLPETLPKAPKAPQAEAADSADPVESAAPKVIDLHLHHQPEETAAEEAPPATTIPESAPEPPSAVSESASDSSPAAKATESKPAPDQSADFQKDAIGPYGEPLVGPLSSLPETDADMKLHQDIIPPQLDMPPGTPESLVYVPLNVLEAGKAPKTTVDVATTDETIAQADESKRS